MSMEVAETVELKSGLRVVLVPMESTKSVTALVMVGVGSRYESPDKNGISHFLEHMVFKGTDRWPKALDLSQAVDGIGAEFNAFTGKEYTGFYVKSTSNHLDLSLDVLTDMLYTPRLRPGDIEREKGVIVEEINMYNDLPQRKVAEIFDGAMYGDYGLGRRIDGSKEVVTGLKQADFKQHLKDWYGPDNTVLVIAGDAELMKNTDALITKVSHFFDKGEDYGSTEVEKVLGFADHGEIQVVVDQKGSDQAHFVLGFPSYGIKHPKRYAQSLLQTVLGGNMSSRLFTEIREKRGLAYYSRVDVDRFTDTGAIAAVAGVDVKRVDDAVKVTLDVFEQVKADGAKKITEEELSRAKEYLAGSLVLSMESSRNVAQYWATRATLGDEIISPRKVIDEVRAVTREEVVAVAQEVFNPEKLVFALVGPFDDSGKFEKLLKFDV